MRTLTPVLGLLLLAGCATKPAVTAPAPDPSLVVLANAARTIQDSWVVIGGIEKARDPEYLARLDEWGKEYPPPLKKRVTLRWSGPLEPVVLALAEQAGLPPPKVVGLRPVKAPNVYFNAQNDRIGDVLRDVGYQVGADASILVDPTPGNESIELIYEKR